MTAPLFDRGRPSHRARPEAFHGRALVHERLYQSCDLAKINFADYLGSLVSRLVRTYRVDHSQIQLDLEAEEIYLHIDTAVPCGLIINELVTNCLKYAFPVGRSGTVTVRLTQREDHVTIHVADDGVGLPDHLDLRNPQTFGLRLMTDLVDQLHGSLQLERGTGTRVRITFPATRPQAVTGGAR